MNVVQEVRSIVKGKFTGEGSGHDWYHIERVWKMACYLQEKEGGDREVVELAALLHDISDHKLNGGILNHGGFVADSLLKDLNYPSSKRLLVVDIIDKVSYKGAKVKDQMNTIEGMIVQDADRLDAIGAIGIARAFAYGGHKSRPLYDPKIQYELHDSFDKYVTAEGHTINHFYEKLLLLKDRLNTKTAQQIGEKRHQYMQGFLNQFFEEWNTEIN